MKKLIVFLALATSVYATVPVPTYMGYTNRVQININISDALGVNDISWVDVSIGTVGANSCMVEWHPGNYFYLFADNGSTITGGYVQGTNTTTSNSQCTLKYATSNGQIINGILYLWLDIGISSTYTGTKTVYMVAGGSQGHDGWHTGGQVILSQSAIPSVSLISPASGASGSTQNFTVAVTDTGGFSDISYMNFAVGSTGASSCMTQWNPGDYIQLFTDSGSSSSGGYAGNAGGVSNSQCSLSLAGSSGTISGANTKYVTFALTFYPGYTGSKTLYAVAGSAAGNSGWQTLGSFTVQSMLLTDIAPTDANLTVMLEDDATGQLLRKPTNSQPWVVKLRSGREVSVANASPGRISRLENSYEPSADNFIYHYKLDTRDIWGFRLGVTDDAFWLNDYDNTLLMPKGWMGAAYAWSANQDAEKSDSSDFTIRSKWRPGLLPMYLVTDKAKEPTPSFNSTDDNEKIAVATSIFNNSLQKFVIGPAIRPNITADEMKALIARWVDDYGYTFLKPLTEGKTLADIETPTDAFEQQILACLRAVESK